MPDEQFQRIMKDLMEDEERHTKRYPIDENGHMFVGKWDRDQYGTTMMPMDFYSDIDWKLQFGLLHDPQEPVDVRPMHECSWCGNHSLKFDGTKLWAPEPCPHPEGYLLKIPFAVPSGKLVVVNDLRPLFDGFQDDAEDYRKYYINSSYGLRNTMQDAPAHDNCLILFVSNTSPTLYKEGDTLTLGNFYGYDRETDEDLEFDIPGSPVAHICTDLWWASMADYDEWKKRGGDEEALNKDHWDSIVEVTPGTYEWEYYMLQKSFDRDNYSKPQVYAKATLFAPASLRSA